MNEAWCVSALCALVGAGCAGAAVQPARQLEAGEVLLSAGVLTGRASPLGGQGQVTWGFGAGDVGAHAAILSGAPKLGASARLYVGDWAMIGAQLERQLGRVPADNVEGGDVYYCDMQTSSAMDILYGKVTTNAELLRGFYGGVMMGWGWARHIRGQGLLDDFFPGCESYDYFYRDRPQSFIGYNAHVIFGFSRGERTFLMREGERAAGYWQVELTFPLLAKPNTDGAQPWSGTDEELIEKLWGVDYAPRWAFSTLLAITYHHRWF